MPRVPSFELVGVFHSAFRAVHAVPATAKSGWNWLHAFIAVDRIVCMKNEDLTMLGVPENGPISAGHERSSEQAFPFPSTYCGRELAASLPWRTQMKAGKGTAAASAHLWLEKTAFFKVPRCLQDETVELHKRPFEDVSDAMHPKAVITSSCLVIAARAQAPERTR